MNFLFVSSSKNFVGYSVICLHRSFSDYCRDVIVVYCRTSSIILEVSNVNELLELQKMNGVIRR